MTTLLDTVQNGPAASDSSRNATQIQPSPPHNHRLPHLELPKFDGTLTEWLTFRDIFSSLVINNITLSPIEKLYYLKNSLTGPAALLMKHTALIGDNFQRSWNDLIAYYDNKRILVPSTLHSLFSIKPMQAESALELKNLFTTVQQNIRYLKMLEQPVQHWDSIIIYLTTRCLDSNTLRAWEMELGSTTEYPKWNQLGDFLVRRMRSLQALDRTSFFGPINQGHPKSRFQILGNRQYKSHVVQNPNPSTLGADVYHLIILDGLKRGKDDDAIAQRSCFGWIVSGPVKQSYAVTPTQGYHCSVENDWHELLERFWRQEGVLDIKPSLSPSDLECENHFKSTHTRTGSGKCLVRLPLKSPLTNLGESKSIALNRLNQLFHRFREDKPFYAENQQFLKEYLDLGHMERVSEDTSEPRPVNYLFHHGVPHPSGVKGKLRVVFNGSSKSRNGTTLNENLHTGAKLQLNIFDVLLWFQKFRYVFSTDIEKMYRQIMVHPDDWCLQRILWKDSLGNILTYNLTTVAYGLACAPFLALRTLNQLVEDEGSTFPLAVPVLTKGRYVDDMFGEGDSITEAQQVAHQVSQLSTAGGFPLRKWISNHPETLRNVPVEHQLVVPSVVIDKPSCVSAIGLSWQPSEDVFHFSLGSPLELSLTKRKIASQIARLFDPLGLIASVIIKAKMLLQELWAVKVGCDDPVPVYVTQQWMEVVNQLPDLQSLRIPRWIGITCSTKLQLHGFADASQSAMAAVVYLKTVVDDQATICLVCAKTKVTPLKRLTIPRLELAAATLLTRLTSHVIKTLELTGIPLFMWTDSSIVHTWINNHPSKWKEYVHNRVCLIQETLPQAQWKLIPSLDNPADCASRGLTPAELSKHPLWWSCPSWLTADPEHWPGNVHAVPQDDLLELRPNVLANLVLTQAIEDWDLLGRYSSLSRLLRITATCQRFVKKFCHRYDGPITVSLTFLSSELPVGL